MLGIQENGYSSSENLYNSLIIFSLFTVSVDHAFFNNFLCFNIVVLSDYSYSGVLSCRI